MIRYSPGAQRSIKHLREKDRQGYALYEKLLPQVTEGKGKVMSGWTELGGCRSLRSGKFRLVYVPGQSPEIVRVGYRKDVYQSNCDN